MSEEKAVEKEKKEEKKTAWTWLKANWLSVLTILVVIAGLVFALWSRRHPAIPTSTTAVAVVTEATTPTCAPTATPASPSYAQTGSGRIEIPSGFSFNTGEVIDLLGKKYLNEIGAVYYVVNKSSKAITLTSVGGGLANSVDVDKLAFTELLGGCGPTGCAKVIFIIVTDNGTQIVTRTK